MINKYILAAICLFVSLHTYSQSSAVQKAAKSVFTLTTYTADGSILAVTRGVYLNKPDEGIAAFKPFIGASSASVIDAAGKKTDVEAIIGANDIYDICRFKLARPAGIPAISVSREPLPADRGWVALYSAKGAGQTSLPAYGVTIKSVEKIADTYNYYVFNEEIQEDMSGCPIFNAAGEVIGLVQRATSSYDIHSTDSRYYSALHTTGLSMHDAVMQKTNIRPALPDDHEQARLMLMMITAADDSIKVIKTTNDYIALYPTDIDGYSTAAIYETSHLALQRADDIMQTAIKKVANKDEAYYEYAKILFNSASVPADLQSDGMENKDLQSDSIKLAKAEELTTKAISLNDQPLYRHLLAKIKIAGGSYDEALPLLEGLTQTDISGSEIYYEAAQCKSAMGANNEDILPYLDKAVEACPKPLTTISAPYYLARGMMLDEMGQYRKAIQDYNVYDTLSYLRADADFYYLRGKCEDKAHQYQQAINDIAHAAVINPQEVTYLAELAAIQLKVKQYDDALKTCNLSMSLTTEYPDIYIVQGVALRQLGRDDEAKEAFLAARELGDPRAATYMEKYGYQ